ncbi:O-antigen ligase family protein [Victivallis vadensis]|uniref:O-antigen ligase family protein n=1 Tax=Victivallis vadensis TaxID=172901 RepID=UPI00266C55EC|nr:O-antigen ligase family protein [Victivallis vadensis]
MLFGSMPYFGDVPLFDLNALPFFAVALIFLRPGFLSGLWRKDGLSRGLLLATGAGILLAAVQQFRLPGPSDRFCVALFYLLLPLAGCAWADCWKRQLPFFLAGLALITLIINFNEFFHKLEPIGLSGNWNWNQTLLAISLPFPFLLLCRKHARLVILTAASSAVFLLWLLFPANTSRAAIIAIPGAALLLLCSQLGATSRIRVLPAILVAAGGVALFLIVMLAPPAPFAAELNTDSRIQLWRGAFDLVNNNILFGVGPGRFEDVIPHYLPEDYFRTPFVADRHPHPHNEILLYLSNFGVIGLIWAVLLIAVLVRGIIRLRSFDRIGLGLAFAALVLLLHGQLDVLLSTPLAGGIFLLLAGMFWKSGAPRPESLQTPIPMRVRQIAVLLCVLAGAYAAWGNFASGLALRSARLARDRGDLSGALSGLKESLNVKPTPQAYLFQGSIELFDRKNPVAAANAFGELENRLGLSNYSHANGLMARALASSGREKEALVYFEREQRNFPLSGLNAGFALMVLRRNASPEIVQAAEERFRTVMAAKGLTPADFPLLLRNPLWDDSPLLLREGLEKQR